MEFISLSEVVKAVASRISIPESWQGAYLRTSEELSRPDALRLDLFNSFASTVYRYSEAAATLDQHIHNASSEQRPQWFDFGQTGRLKRSEAAHDVAMAMLVHTANWGERFQKAFDEKKITWQARTNNIPAHEGQFKSREDSERLQEIGFDRTEIGRFLDSNGIHYVFDDVPTTQSIEMDAKPIRLSDNLPGTTEAACTSLDSTERGAKPQKTVATGKVHSIKKRRRNELDSAIDEAIRRAGNDDTKLVFLQLKEIALEGVLPFTGDVTGGKLSYTDAKNEVKILNIEQLSNRLSRRRTSSSR